MSKYYNHQFEASEELVERINNILDAAKPVSTEGEVGDAADKDLNENFKVLDACIHIEGKNADNALGTLSFTVRGFELETIDIAFSMSGAKVTRVYYSKACQTINRHFRCIMTSICHYIPECLFFNEGIITFEEGALVESLPGTYEKILEFLVRSAIHAPSVDSWKAPC